MAGVTVHRLGGSIVLDGRVSWSPEGVKGVQDVNCYLIRGESGAVLVDTGLRLHEDAVIEGLTRHLPPGMPLSILLSRTEMECCLNLPAIERRFPVDAVWYTGGITVPRSAAGVRRVSVAPGESLWIEPYAGLRLEIVSPLMRLLPTLWVYEPETGTLLTSDAFTHAGPDGRSADAGLQKFRWFDQAWTKPIADNVRAVVDSRPVTVIGPGMGAPIQGADAVRAEAGALALAIETRGVR
jgi:hypothetical protein